MRGAASSRIVPCAQSHAVSHTNRLTSLSWHKNSQFRVRAVSVVSLAAASHPAPQYAAGDYKAARRHFSAAWGLAERHPAQMGALAGVVVAASRDANADAEAAAIGAKARAELLGMYRAVGSKYAGAMEKVLEGYA